MNFSKTAPKPQGHYVPARRCGNLVFTAGMTPRKDGVLIMTGKVGADADLSLYKEAVRLAAGNALTAAASVLTEGESIKELLSVTVYVNAEEGFTRHPAFADYASDFFAEVLGEAGVAARCAVGVSSLPGGAPCEISVIAHIQ